MGLWVFLQFSSTIKNNMLAVIDTLSRKMKKEWDAQMEKHLTSTIGVLSLSAKHDNLSMWSHYASNHSGLVIAVDETAAIFHESLSDKDELRHLRQVVYSKHKPSLTLQTASGVEFLLRKSVEWEHEDEWRIIKTLDSANAVGLAISPTGGLVDSDVRLFTLPASAIQGVVLGARMAAIYRERLQNSLTG